MKQKFEEVNKTLTKEEAFKEAKRCLSCKKPRCVTGCPASLPIPEFIAKLKEEDIDGAMELILTRSNLSPICSRVCAHEKQCIGNCILNAKGAPINVGGLERFVNDYAEVNLKKVENFIDYKVAIIGGGPAGLSCALELVKNGIHATVFEKEKYAGGVVSYGIPEYRLPKKVLNKHLLLLERLGVEFKYEQDMSNATVEKLKAEGYNKIFVSVGLTGSKKMRVKNEDANGVYDANQLLRKVNAYVSYGEGEEVSLKGKTVVVGAGNVAMDAARTAVRIGEEVVVVYRRTMEEAPASKVELHEAIEEGVKFQFLTNPVEVMVDENSNVTGMKCEKMILGEPDKTGRPAPVGSGEYEIIECDNIIVAIGQDPVKSFTVINNIDINPNGYIQANEDQTNVEDVYAGGDIVRGADTVVRSMVDGKRVAQKIIESLK